MSSGATPPAPGGLKSTLKIAVPIVALMSVIFGITLLSRYTPEPIERDKGAGGDSGQTRTEPPLRFFTSTRTWDPPLLTPEYRHLPLLAPSADPSKEDPLAFSLQDRIFQGFYEPSPEVRRAAFWFENRNPQSVTLQLKGVNCGACSGGRLASIPPEVTKAYLHRTALAALPIGVFNAFGVGLADPAAEFSKLNWTTHKFSESPNATYKVAAAPAVADKWAPQWGILELTFSVSKDPKVPLESVFATQVDGTDNVGGHKFSIFFAPSEPFAVSRPTIDVGEINQLTGDREYTFLLYSATRGPGSEFGDLDKPVCTVQATPGIDPGPFVAVTNIQRVPDGDLFEVAQQTAKTGRLTKVQAAYRITVALRPQVGDARLDIGAFDRTVFMTVGNSTASVKISAMVRGAVWLANGKTEIEIPTFKGRLGTVHTPELVTESSAIELAVAEDECRPRFFKYELVKKPERGGQGYYDLKITVPPTRQYGAIDRSSVVVLEVRPAKGAKGPGAAPQRIRIPVRGSGEQG